MVMGMGEIRGLITVITFVTFLAICWWAYRSANRQRFEQDALMPFLDDEAVEAHGGIDASSSASIQAKGEER
jgi:cytochrome c oxidase cbb3-type subunit 4